MKKITNKIAEKILAHFESDKVKALIEETKSANKEDTGTFRVVITTENLDRYQEVISINGWELDHYMNNPVVLWGHDHNKLIAVCTNLTVEDGKLIAEGKFAPTEEGQEKRKLYDQGFLKATSVGFIEKEREGNLITKAELLEFSFVSVPANPYALSLAMEKEVSINELVIKGIFTLKEKDVDPDNEKGAVADEIETAEAREKKWKNFSQVDDVILSFWKVYFDEKTAVGDFEKLLDETIEILKSISAGEKDFNLTGVIKEIEKAPEILTRVALSMIIKDGALEAVEPERTDDDEVEEEETEDEKSFRLKKSIQEADTILGDVLAELRQKSRRS